MNKILNEINTLPRILYLTRLLFRFEGMILNLMNRKWLGEFIALKLIFQETQKKKVSLNFLICDYEHGITQCAHGCPLLHKKIKTT